MGKRRNSEGRNPEYQYINIDIAISIKSVARASNKKIPALPGSGVSKALGIVKGGTR
jgi:hypothetical protein